MKATTVTTTAQAPTPLAAPVRHLYLPEHSQSATRRALDNLDPDQLQIRADTVTVVLKQMRVEPVDYRGYGIND